MKKKKRILLNIIKAFKPFGGEIETIGKFHEDIVIGTCHLVLGYKNLFDGVNSPSFPYAKMFKGMEIEKDYRATLNNAMAWWTQVLPYTWW